MIYKKLSTLLLGLSVSLYANIAYAEVSEAEFMNIFQQAVISKDNTALESLVRDNPEQTKNINKKLRNVPKNSPQVAQLKQLGELLWEAGASALAEKAEENGTLPTIEELQDAIKTQ